MPNPITSLKQPQAKLSRDSVYALSLSSIATIPACALSGLMGLAYDTGRNAPNGLQAIANVIWVALTITYIYYGWLIVAINIVLAVVAFKRHNPLLRKVSYILSISLFIGVMVAWVAGMASIPPAG